LAGNFPGDLGWNQRYQIFTGICHGLRHLHDEQCIFHGDIKPDNILLDENLEPKIIDFGLSRFFEGDYSRIFTKHIAGTM
jgi:serine/threonine protein kinase